MSSKTTTSRRTFLFGGFALLFGSALFLWGSAVALTVQEIYEKISLAIAPSGERAYEYGELHFNGQDPQEYDVNTAMYFFRQALALDPSLPYVHHEIARIYFLRGDFGDALAEINMQVAQEGDKTPNSYYVRGLIEGYMGDYTDAANDYAHFLQFDPHDWAGLNDYAWVLLKAGRYSDAARATSEGLQYYPQNPWLLNSNAIALYETGHVKEALAPAQAAVTAGAKLTEADWLHAYPGNDPKVASEGIASFQQAAAANLQQIESALASTTTQRNSQ